MYIYKAALIQSIQMNLSLLDLDLSQLRRVYMKWIYKYDDDFIYVPGEDICIENDDPIPSSYTDIKPRDGLYIGKFTPKKMNGSNRLRKNISKN